MSFQLFIDMDGVLADFDAGYQKLTGIRPDKKVDNVDNVDWNLVKRTPGFYQNLPPMQDFHIFWKYFSDLNPIILTGVPKSVEEAESNKRSWITKHIGISQPMIACRSSEKSLHIRNPGDTLIDDWEKFKHVWEKRGGRWITHISAINSIREFQRVIGLD